MFQKTRRQSIGGRPPVPNPMRSPKQSYLSYRDIVDFVLETAEKSDAPIGSQTAWHSPPTGTTDAPGHPPTPPLATHWPPAHAAYAPSNLLLLFFRPTKGFSLLIKCTRDIALNAHANRYHRQP